MELNHNRIIHQTGHLWVNYGTDGWGPETRHYKLSNAIQRASRCIEKVGSGKIEIKNENGDTLIYAIVGE